MNKSFKWLSLVLLIVLLISACGGATPTEAPPEEVVETEEPTEPEAPPPEAEGPFRVAVVMPSPTNDLAFSQSIFDALAAIESEMGTTL
jgi:predicted small lipoprotein YifL